MGVKNYFAFFPFYPAHYFLIYTYTVLSIDISKNTQTLILTIFSGAIATYEDS